MKISTPTLLTSTLLCSLALVGCSSNNNNTEEDTTGDTTGDTSSGFKSELFGDALPKSAKSFVLQGGDG